MRKMFLALFTLATGTVALAQSNTSEKMEGNGKLVKREVAVASFSSLKASGVYELKLTQGSKESVTIEADENLQDIFTVKNEGDKLVIDMKKRNSRSINSKNKMRIYVTFKNLKQLDISTVGEVSSGNQLAFEDLKLNNNSVGEVDLDLTARKLHLENKSVGELKLSGKAQEAVFINNGVGNLDAGNLVVQTMDIDNSGVGAAEVNVVKGLKVKESFLGKVKNKGAARTTKKNIVVI